MAGKKAGENSKKAQGQARKADAAAGKAAKEDAQKADVEDAKWSKGGKDESKKAAEAEKKAEQARKKAELKALEAEEDSSLPDKPQKKGKAAEKKTNSTSRGLDLSQLDGDSKGTALNASGIDNALDALTITSGSNDKIDKHPERRFKAAYAAFEERRLAEMDSDGSGAGLRLNQKKDKLRKEFEKSPDNPFNQVSAAYNSTRGDIADMREKEKTKIENRLK